MELDTNDEIAYRNSYSEELRDESDLPQDLPPEFSQYRDEGCDLAESCLSCPFEQCIYDEPGGKQHLVKDLRDKEIVRLFTAGQKGVKELSEMFNVSRRTVQRALKNSPDMPNKEKSKE